MLDDLKQAKRSKFVAAKSLLDKAEAEKRDLTPAEQREFDVMNAELDAMNQRIDMLDAQERGAAAVEETFRRLGIAPSRQPSETDAQAVDGLRAMLLENNPRPVAVHDPEPRKAYQPGVERRALATTSPANFSPVSFYGQIVEAMVDASAVLSAGATVLTTSTGETLRVPRATALSTASIIAEGNTITESDPTLGVVALGAHKYAILVTVNRELLEDSGADLQAYLARETGTAIGLGMGNHFINGTGTGQPRGVLADATAGVTGPTGTATSLGSQSTAGQGTDLLNNLFASVAEPYTRQPSAGFLTRNATLAAIRNLKSSTGDLVGSQYLVSAPAPFYPDAYVPAMAADAKSILFGDWSRYFVRMVNGIRFERSDDFKFDTDQVTFRAILRADGALIDTSAIKYFANSAT